LTSQDQNTLTVQSLHQSGSNEMTCYLEFKIEHGNHRKASMQTSVFALVLANRCHVVWIFGKGYAFAFAFAFTFAFTFAFASTSGLKRSAMVLARTA
jgi:hypothetical protein